MSLETVAAAVVPSQQQVLRMKYSQLLIALSVFAEQPLNALVLIHMSFTQMFEVSNSVLLAANSLSKEADFGGFVGPVVGLLTIGAFILVLSPPLQD